MAPVQPQSPAGVDGAGASQELLLKQYAELFQAAQGQPSQGAGEPAPGPPSAAPAYEETRQLQAALSRSMAAESALQAELTPLRERLAQVEGQVESQKTQLVQGVQRLLEPLAAALKTYGYDVSVGQSVPVAVQVLRQARTEQAQQEQAARQGAQEQGRQGRSGLEMLERLRLEVAGLTARLDHLSGQAPLAATSPPDPPPDGYGTWVVTDQRAYDLERELLREQTQRGGLAYGDR